MVLVCVTAPLNGHAAEKKPDPLKRGLAFFNKEDYPRAQSEFKRVLKANPKNARAHYYLGLTQGHLGNLEEAILSYEEAAELRPNLPGIHLHLGMAYYRLKSFPPALLELHRAVEQNPKQGSPHFFIGLVHYARKEHDKAISHFKQAAELDRDYAQLAWYYTGLSHYHSKRRQKAKHAFRQTIRQDPKSDTAQDAREFLQSLAGVRKKKKPWWAKAGTGIEYDDNLTVDPADTTSELGDAAFVFELGGGYKFLDDGQNEAEISYEFSQSLYTKRTEFDFQSHSIGLSGNREVQNWNLNFDYGFNTTTLGRDGFLQTHTFSPTVGRGFWDKTLTSLGWDLTFKNFLGNRNEARDGVNNALRLSHFIFFMDYRAYALLGIGLEKENTDGPRFDYTGLNLSAATKVPLNKETDLKLSYRFRHKNYDSITPSIGQEREDNKHTLKIAVAHEIKSWDFELSFRRIASNSNLPVADFTENIFFGGVLYNF